MLLTLITVAAAADPALLVQPFLQSPTPTSVWVVWETDSDGPSAVHWGPTDALGSTTAATTVSTPGSAVHSAQLTGLQPGARLFYQVRTGPTASATYDLITPQPVAAEAPLRFVAMSDMQYSTRAPGKFEEIVSDGVITFTEQSWSPDLAAELDLAIVPGDLVDNGWMPDEWRETFFAPGAPLFAHVPVYPVPGNHEANTPLFFRYFHLPENGTPEALEHWWYADHSNVRFIGLDSNTGYRTDTQLTWLADTLDAACVDDTIDFVFAQLHHPYLSEVWVPGELDYTGEVITLLEQFTDVCNKPSVHFFGHTHAYSRGQSRDHRHLWVNVASAGGALDVWGEQEQRDYEQFTVSTDDWGFVLVEVTAGDDPSFRLRRISRGNEREGVADNVVTDDLTVRSHDSAPRQPVAMWPVDVLLDPSCVPFKASQPHDPDGDPHAASHWRLDRDCDGSFEHERWRQSQNLFARVDRAAGDDLTDERFTELAPMADWCWQVRYRDDGLSWSAWSATAAFQTAPAPDATGDLLLNPGAEQGLDGWQITAGSVEAMLAEQCDGTTPRSGEAYFAVGGVCEPSAYGELRQTVDVSAHADPIDAGTRVARYGGWMRTFAGRDLPGVQLRLLAADGAALAVTEPLSTTATEWTEQLASVPVPAGTRALELVLSGTRNAGEDNDAYLDDLVLELIPAADCALPEGLIEPDPPADASNDPQPTLPVQYGCGCTHRGQPGAWLLLPLLLLRRPRSRHAL